MQLMMECIAGATTNQFEIVALEADAGLIPIPGVCFESTSQSDKRVQSALFGVVVTGTSFEFTSVCFEPNFINDFQSNGYQLFTLQAAAEMLNKPEWANFKVPETKVLQLVIGNRSSFDFRISSQRNIILRVLASMRVCGEHWCLEYEEMLKSRRTLGQKT
jgi:hypothetical protein